MFLYIQWKFEVISTRNAKIIGLWHDVKNFWDTLYLGNLIITSQHDFNCEWKIITMHYSAL